jgi:putative DNA primase/helicase
VTESPVPAPHVSEVFADALSGVQLSPRNPLAPMLERSGVYRLTDQSPSEDVRDACERLKAESVTAALDPTDRATLGKAVLDAFAAAGVRHAGPIFRAVLGEVIAPGESRTSDSGTAPLTLTDDEPAAELVAGATLLDDTTALVGRHIVLTPAKARAIALWVAAAYMIDALQLMPMLLVTAPTMRAGKTTLLTLLGAIVPRALAASNLTGAVLARAIATYRPTLLADEADTWLTDEASELRGILNAGHTRATAYILRCAPETHEPQRIPCFGARVLAMIRRPPATISDRAIAIALQRKRADEPVQRMRLDRLHAEHAPLRRQWRRWADDHLAALRDLDPPVPAELHDRAADNWRPLLAVADLAGAWWPARARAAALELSGGEEAEETATIDLLRDIRDVFEERGVDVLASSDLASALVAMTDRPWAEWSHGRPLTAAKLARQLATFSIAPHVQRIGTKTPRAYRRAAFEDAWARYPPPNRNTATTPTNTGVDPRFPEVQQKIDVALPNRAIQPMNTDGCCTVALSDADPAPKRTSGAADLEDGLF